MKPLEAEYGETAYDLLVRAISYCKEYGQECVLVLHNGVKIRVFADSHISDVCDKYDLQRELNRYKEGWTR